MENQDLDLIGQTAGNMPYKIGIVDKDGKVTNQFVVKASTNRIDIPQSSLGTGGGVTQLPANIILFSGLAFGNISLVGPTQNYDNIGDGLLLTLSNLTGAPNKVFGNYKEDAFRFDLSSIGLKPIKIPKEKLVVNSSFDISNQLSQYIGKTVSDQIYRDKKWIDWKQDDFKIVSFGGATIQVLPNATLNMSLTVNTQIIGSDLKFNDLPILVSQVNTYKN